jgi:hypothetical protein
VCLSINVKEAGCRVRVENLTAAIRFYVYMPQGLEIRLVTPFHDPRALCKNSTVICHGIGMVLSFIAKSRFCVGCSIFGENYTTTIGHNVQLSTLKRIYSVRAVRQTHKAMRKE